MVRPLRSVTCRENLLRLVRQKLWEDFWYLKIRWYYQHVGQFILSGITWIFHDFPLGSDLTLCETESNGMVLCLMSLVKYSLVRTPVLYFWLISKQKVRHQVQACFLDVPIGARLTVWDSERRRTSWHPQNSVADFAIWLGKNQQKLTGARSQVGSVPTSPYKGIGLCKER